MRRAGWLAATSRTVLAPGWAHAQAVQGQAEGATGAESARASGSQDGASQGGTRVDPLTGDIIVTALKRSQASLKVPAAISVIGGGDLKTVGVNSVNDVQNLVPGVTIGTGAFGTNVSIRGVTSTDETSKGELGIAFNIDGAFIGRGQEQGVAFFDLDRVEVLRGPQGTLYGRSSTGGAINVITKKPVLGEFSGYAKLEYGNYNTKRAEAALNIPVTETLALRVAGNFNNRDGYLKPVDSYVSGNTGSAHLSAAGQPAKNDEDNRTGRFSALFKPNDSLTATVIATVGHIGGVGPGTALGDNLDAGGAKQFQILPDPVPAWQRMNFANFNEQLNVKLGGIQLDLLASEQHFTDHSQTTGNANPFNVGSTGTQGEFLLDNYNGVFNTTQFEARISNVNEGLIDYVAGANYYHEHIRESDHNWYAPITADGDAADSSTWSTAIDPVNTTTHQSYGIFGQLTFHATSKLSVVGGLRYTHDQSRRIGTFAVNTPADACTYPNDCTSDPTYGTVSNNNGLESDSKVTWKAGINYQASARNLFYVSVSTGFKAGGFNDFDPRTGQSGVPYKPEQLTAYEIGYKGRPLDKLTFTSSAFYYDYSADQINGLALFLSPSGVTGVLYTQVVPVEIYGWENEARYQFNRNTTFTLGVAYEHSRIVSLETGYLGYLTGVFANWHDYALPNLPKFTANLALTHNVDLKNNAQLRFRVASKISDGYWLNDYANAVQYRQSAFTRTDMSLTYATQADRLTVQLFVENIENNLQKTAGPGGYNGTYGAFTGGVPGAEADGTYFPTKSVNFGVSMPRLFGVRLGAKF